MMSGRIDSRSFTPAANTNSESSALYTEGNGIPTSPRASAMPCSAALVRSAFSAEKQTPDMRWPSSARSLSLAVTTATRAPASEKAARMVPQRR